MTDLLGDESRVTRTRNRLQRMAYSMSLFLIYFGTRRQYPNLLHHNIIFGPRYRELLKDIFSRGRLADDFSLYLHAPNSLRSEPGASRLRRVLCSFASAPSRQAYHRLGKRRAALRGSRARLSGAPLHARSAENILTQRIFTPKDFKTELNAHLGSAFSLEPKLTQSAYFRVHNRDRNISGLYFVGAGTHPGAGIPGVVNSAKATAGLIVQDFAAELARVEHTQRELSYA